MSGLDYAVNRYYSSGLGRFTSPDPYRATTGSVNNPSNPSSWNRYAYVLGDPISFRDKNGLQAQGVVYVCRDTVEGLGVDCWYEEPDPGPGGPSPSPAPPDPERIVGPPSGAQYAGYNQAYDDLLKPDCASLIAGNSGANAETLRAKLWNAGVTEGTTLPGNGPVQVTALPNGE